MKEYLSIHSEVRDAIADGKPVLALESTVIAHGLPYPENVQTAADMEAVARKHGVVPATIGLLDGQIIVGLNPGQVERLASEKNVAKVSRADFAPVLAAKRDGATTVAATMMVSEMAGIRFFATGGIGGVHRGAQDSFDISADLAEFSKSRVAVICAGPKAVLDLGLTLEVLETLGVPVIGFQSLELPAFYSRESGYQLSYRCNSASELAKVIWNQWSLGLAGGVLITNPPPESVALGRGEVEGFIGQALKECEEKAIRGKSVTPFLLSRLSELSGGKTLGVNTALLKNNAELASQVAKEFWRMVAARAEVGERNLWE